MGQGHFPSFKQLNNPSGNHSGHTGLLPSVTFYLSRLFLKLPWSFKINVAFFLFPGFHRGQSICGKHRCSEPVCIPLRVSKLLKVPGRGKWSLMPLSIWMYCLSWLTLPCRRGPDSLCSSPSNKDALCSRGSRQWQGVVWTSGLCLPS